MQMTLNSQNYTSLVVYDCFSGPFLANTTPVFYKHIVLIELWGENSHAVMLAQLKTDVL